MGGCGWRRAGRRAGVWAAAMGLVAGLLVASGPPAAGLGAGSARVGTAPAVPRGAARLGALPGGTQLRLDVVLRPRDPAGLAAFASAVSTPGSPLYRRYLGPGGFAAAFGPAPATVRAVEQGLRGLGLPPGSVDANRLAIHVAATAAAASRAFGLSIERYRLPGGRAAFANTAAPRLPASIAGAVQTVLGLDSLGRWVPAGLARPRGTTGRTARPHVATGGPQPCGAALTTASAYGAYTADQLASAYGFAGLYGAGDLGSGATVALLELEPNAPSDIAAYQACYGTSASVRYVAVDGGAGGGPGQGEAALDIEDVIGLAPGANLLVYRGPNGGTGPYDTFAAIVDDDAAQVVSTSWGICEPALDPGEAQAEATLFQQAAAQGQTVVSASGDTGSEDCKPVNGSKALAVDDPASQPYVTGVGGTTLSQPGPPPAEQVWNDQSPRIGAGGGGISALWPMPSYQSGAPPSLNVVNGNSSATPCAAPAGYCREVPDVSADADPATGYVIYWNGTWQVIGGTSAAAPLWAALVALADAGPSCRGRTIGFMNPALYAIAGGPGYASAFTDVVSGNNDFTGTNGGLFPAGPGYDMASGLGSPVASSPSGGGLAAQLCTGALTATSVGLMASATSVVVGEAVTFTATVTPPPPSATVAFLLDGAPIPGCAAAPVDPAGGIAVCQTSFADDQWGVRSVVATYAGDAAQVAGRASVSELIRFRALNLRPAAGTRHARGSVLRVTWQLADVTGAPIDAAAASALAAACRVRVLLAGLHRSSRCAAYDAAANRFVYRTRLPATLAPGLHRLTAVVRSGSGAVLNRMRHRIRVT